MVHCAVMHQTKRKGHDSALDSPDKITSYIGHFLSDQGKKLRSEMLELHF